MTTMTRIGSAGNDAPFHPAAVSVLLLKTKERSFEADKNPRHRRDRGSSA
jgi:hypothetical protein